MPILARQHTDPCRRFQNLIPESTSQCRLRRTTGCPRRLPIAHRRPGARETPSESSRGQTPQCDGRLFLPSHFRTRTCAMVRAAQQPRAMKMNLTGSTCHLWTVRQGRAALRETLLSAGQARQKAQPGEAVPPWVQRLSSHHRHTAHGHIRAPPHHLRNWSVHTRCQALSQGPRRARCQREKG